MCSALSRVGSLIHAVDRLAKSFRSSRGRVRTHMLIQHRFMIKTSILRKRRKRHARKSSLQAIQSQNIQLRQIEIKKNTHVLTTPPNATCASILFLSSRCRTITGRSSDLNKSRTLLCSCSGNEDHFDLIVCFETFFTCGLSQAKRLDSRAGLVSSLSSSSGLERLRFVDIVFVDARVCVWAKGSSQLVE